MMIGEEINIYSSNPIDYEECSDLPQATTLRVEYEMRSIQPTPSSVTSEGGENKEITASQETREYADTFRKRKKSTMILCSTCLNLFCFICVFVGAGVVICMILEK